MTKPLTIPEKPKLHSLYQHEFEFEEGEMGVIVHREMTTDLFVVDICVIKGDENQIVTRNVEKSVEDCEKEILRKQLLHFCKVDELLQ